MLATTPLEAVKELDDALERGDLEAVLSFYEDDAVVVVEPGRLACRTAEMRRAMELEKENAGKPNKDSR